MNIVVIPCFDRPEFLHVTLELITKADNYKDYLYLFQCDYGFDLKNIEVIDNFDAIKVINRTKFTGYREGKQSFNVLSGLITAAQHTKELVFLIEDDVFIGKDYFTFHEDLHKKEKDIFCSILAKNHNMSNDYETLDKQNYYYLSSENHYQGIGTTFNKAIIKKYIQKHFNVEYFKNVSLYCKKNFKGLDSWGMEQDGLIRRILTVSELKTAFAHVPRCYHAGWYSYHRGKKLKMTFDKKVNEIKNIAFNKEKMRQINNYFEHYINDSEPCNLITKHTELKEYTKKLSTI